MEAHIYFSIFWAILATAVYYLYLVYVVFNENPAYLADKFYEQMSSKDQADRSAWSAARAEMILNSQNEFPHKKLYYFARNQFFYYNTSELNEWILSPRISDMGLKKVKVDPDTPKSSPGVRGYYPGDMDWRIIGRYFRNPGNQLVDFKTYCKCSWAFATAGLVEMHLAVRYGRGFKVSIQHLIDCCYLNKGCGGGSVKQGLFYLKHNDGRFSYNYRYVGKQQDCDPGVNKTKISNEFIKIEKFYQLPPANVEVMERYLSQHPLAVEMQATVNLLLYGGGIITDDSLCTQNAEDINHSVIIVGFGYDEQNDTNYWIVKNSWGQGWGEQGFFRIISGENLCNIEQVPYFPGTIIFKSPSIRHEQLFTFGEFHLVLFTSFGSGLLAYFFLYYLYHLLVLIYYLYIYP